MLSVTNKIIWHCKYVLYVRLLRKGLIFVCYWWYWRYGTDRLHGLVDEHETCMQEVASSKPSFAIYIILNSQRLFEENKKSYVGLMLAWRFGRWWSHCRLSWLKVYTVPSVCHGECQDVCKSVVNPFWKSLQNTHTSFRKIRGKM
jgi:hypothetical protein